MLAALGTLGAVMPMLQKIKVNGITPAEVTEMLARMNNPIEAEWANSLAKFFNSTGFGGSMLEFMSSGGMMRAVAAAVSGDDPAAARVVRCPHCDGPFLI